MNVSGLAAGDRYDCIVDLNGLLLNESDAPARFARYEIYLDSESAGAESLSVVPSAKVALLPSQNQESSSVAIRRVALIIENIGNAELNQDGIVLRISGEPPRALRDTGSEAYDEPDAWVSVPSSPFEFTTAESVVLDSNCVEIPFRAEADEVAWGNISGDIEDQTDLIELIEGISSGALARQNHEFDTAGLEVGEFDDVDLTALKTAQLLRVTTDFPARVRGYTTDASRTADSGRGEVTCDEDGCLNLPEPGTGVIFDVLTDAETLFIQMTPATTIYNGDDTPVATWYLRVDRRGGAGGTSEAIHCTLNVLKMEE